MSRGVIPNQHISIHALLAESDRNGGRSWMYVLYFYPRSPCGERLVGASQGSDTGDISIHALLAESDRARSTYGTRTAYFYPRSPCGERRSVFFIIFNACCTFLSTLSLRRATSFLPLSLTSIIIFLSTLSLRRATCVVSVQVGRNV